MSDDDDQYTPPPRDIQMETWKEVGRLRRKLDEHDRNDREQFVNLFGLPGQPGGRVSALEETVEKHAENIARHERALDRLDRVTWKIMAAAALGGGLVALVANIVKLI